MPESSRLLEFFWMKNKKTLRIESPKWSHSNKKLNMDKS
jgi:hypothetical protein